VSNINTNSTTVGMAAISARAKDAVAQAVPAGKRAGTTAVQGAVSAREWATPRVQDAVHDAREWATPRVQDAVRGAREWAAPQFEAAADAVDTSVAPTVSSALRSAASQVRPDSATKIGLRRLLDWRLLLGLGAALAAAGTTAAIAMRRRYASATAEAKDATDSPDEGSTASESANDVARSEVNGQITTPKS
jgi:hypothetical protein